MRPALSAAQLRATTIGRPAWGKKGYRVEDVDAFLARAAEALDARAAGRVPGMSAQDVADVVFRRAPFGGGRGYDQAEVDTLLDTVEAALR